MFFRNFWGQGQEKRQRLVSDVQLASVDLQALYQQVTPTEAERFMLVARRRRRSHTQRGRFFQKYSPQVMWALKPHVMRS